MRSRVMTADWTTALSVFKRGILDTYRDRFRHVVDSSNGEHGLVRLGNIPMIGGSLLNQALDLLHGFFTVNPIGWVVPIRFDSYSISVGDRLFDLSRRNEPALITGYSLEFPGQVTNIKEIIDNYVSLSPTIHIGYVFAEHRLIDMIPKHHLSKVCVLFEYGGPLVPSNDCTCQSAWSLD